MSKNAKRLLAGFRPANYKLELEPDVESLAISGNVEISGQKAGRPSQRITFHQKGLKIKSARLVRHDKKGDEEIPITRINHQNSLDEVRLHAESMLYPGSYTVQMTFSGTVSSKMTGIYYSDYKVNAKTKRMVSSQFESHHARQAFPCIDEPEAKATFELTLLSPTGQSAISNMPAKSHTKKNGKLATTFEVTPRISTYLLALAYGDFQHKVAKTKSGVEVGVWATKAHRPEALDFPLKTAVRAIEFFEDFFDTPYPLPKLDNLAVADFSAAGMENWGLITYREMALLVDPKTTSQAAREQVAECIAHEAAHQWFGNLVTMKWWDEIWLNESFANIMSYVALEKLFPEWKMWDDYATSWSLSAIRRDTVAGVQAVQTPVHHPDEINSVFDPSIVYAKGGRVIDMTMNYLERDKFRAGLKLYFAKHAYGNTTGEDLWSALLEASGKDISHFTAPWLTRSGLPLITVAQKGKKLRIEQRHFLLDKAKIDPNRIWPVSLLCDTQGVPELLQTRSLDVTLPTSDFVRINQGSVGHYLVYYSEPTHAQAIAKLAGNKKIEGADRLMLINDSAMLARASEHSLADTLHLLEHFTNEDSDAVWDIMALTIDDARRFIDLDENLEEPIKALIRRLVETEYKRLGYKEKPEESSQDTKLRATILGLGVYAEHPAILKQMLLLFDKYKTQPLAVSPELRGIVFGAAVRNRAHDSFDYLLALDDSTESVDLKEDIAGALCLTPDATQAKTLLARLQDSGKVRQHDVVRWVIYLTRNRFTRELAWRWLRDNWPWIRETFSGDHHYDVFPRYVASVFNTQKFLEEYKTFFSPLLTELELRRNITLGIEELETRVVWLKRDLKSIKTFFKN
jgi:aminopeptidase N